MGQIPTSSNDNLYEACSAATPKSAAGTLRAKLWKGASFTVAGYAVSQVLALSSNLILTRLLFPEAFGLMALVNVFLQGLKMFSDVGITPAIIQSPHGDNPEFLNTAWTIQVARGILLSIVSLGIAFPLADWYEQPDLLWVLPIAGLSSIALGFNSTKQSSANRNLLLGRLTIIDLASQAIGLLTLVLLALWLRSVWGLVIGGVIGTIIRTLMSHYCLPGIRNRLLWNHEMAMRLLAFGKWIFLATALSFVAMQGDRLMLGKLVSLEMLGVYSIAYMLSQQPRAVLSRVSSQVIYPAVAMFAHLPRESLRGKLAKNRWPILLGMAALIALMVAFGDQVVLLLWDERYEAASWMFPILALGVWPRVLDQTTSVALMAIGKLQYNPIGSVGRIAVVVLLLPVIHMRYGLTGAVVTIALADLPNYLSHLVGLSVNRLGQVRQDIAATLLFAGMLGALLLIRGVFGISTPRFMELLLGT